VLIRTLYGESLVLIPVMPRHVGIWVETIVMAAEVTKALMGG
jgi:hypothetical protein